MLATACFSGHRWGNHGNILFSRCYLDINLVVQLRQATCAPSQAREFITYRKILSLGRGTLLRRDRSLSRVTRWPTVSRKGAQQIHTALHWPLLRAAKRATYPELLRNGPGRLVVLGSEVGDRWGTGALALVREAARPARSPPRSGYRLGSALVDEAVGRRSARDRPIGGRWGGWRRRAQRQTIQHSSSCWTSLMPRGPAC